MEEKKFKGQVSATELQIRRAEADDIIFKAEMEDIFAKINAAVDANVHETQVVIKKIISKKASAFLEELSFSVSGVMSEDDMNVTHTVISW